MARKGRRDIKWARKDPIIFYSAVSGIAEFSYRFRRKKERTEIAWPF